MYSTIIIIIYFEIVNFFHAQLGLDIYPEMKDIIPEDCPIRLQTEQFHILIHILPPSLPATAHTFLSSNLHISIGWHLFLPSPHSYVPDAQTILTAT